MSQRLTGLGLVTTECGRSDDRLIAIGWIGSDTLWYALWDDASYSCVLRCVVTESGICPPNFMCMYVENACVSLIGHEALWYDATSEANNFNTTIAEICELYL